MIAPAQLSVHLGAGNAQRGGPRSGRLTALFAATIGLLQTDIKKVLALLDHQPASATCFLGVGVGAFSAGVFHLMTHAFLQGPPVPRLGECDSRHGRRAGHAEDGAACAGHMPITFGTFSHRHTRHRRNPGLVPGFFSKDEILGQAIGSPYGGPWLWALGIVAAGLTSFYMFPPVVSDVLWRLPRRRAHQAPLARIAREHDDAVARPGDPLGHRRLRRVAGALVVGQSLRSLPGAGPGRRARERTSVRPPSTRLMSASVLVALIGVRGRLPLLYGLSGFGRICWRGRPGARLTKLILNKYYIDELYDLLFVAPRPWHSRRGCGASSMAVSSTAWSTARPQAIGANSSLWRRLQTGQRSTLRGGRCCSAPSRSLGYYAWR